MSKHGRSLESLWSEVLTLFDNESCEDLFIRATYYASPGLGITVMDQWVWCKYIRQRKGLTLMPRGKAKTGVPSHETTQSFKGFVTLDLTDEQFAQFDKDYPRVFTSKDYLNDFLQYYKLTVTPRDGSFNACAFPQVGKNSGYALSAFADTPHEAMALVVFKANLIHANDWATIVKRPARRRG